jgi:DNA modification methylase
MKRERVAGPELIWPGKRSPAGATSGPARELAPLEIVGDPGGRLVRDRLIRGDNREVMRALLPTLAGRVDLVYLDPPFGTGGSFAMKERATGTTDDVAAYHDRVDDGLGDYLGAMLEQLTLMRALLSDRGTIFVHCDWHVSHYLRCLLDEVFGAECFKNEIVWRYRRWPSKTRAFQRMHDVLFWYGKTDEDLHAWTPAFEPLAKSTLATFGTKQQVADFSSGRRKPSQTDEQSPGAPLSDVWEIGIIAPIAHERVGYPTQKPEALLRRIVETTTRPGDLVADFFAGSGTTLVTAQKLGRRWIGCDMGQAAIHAARKRLCALPGAAFEILAPGGVNLVEDAGAPLDGVGATLVAHADGRAEVALEGEGAAAVDAWAIDWDHDGRVFRNAWHAFRRTARDRVLSRAEHSYADMSPRRVEVRIADAGGAERRVALAFPAAV